MTRTLEDIRKDDAACTTYSDGSIHCGEPGDNIAADRRQLLALLKQARNANVELRIALNRIAKLVAKEQQAAYDAAAENKS